MKQHFEQLTTLENGRFSVKENKHMGGIHPGSYTFSDVYTAFFEYRGIVIELMNELGHQNIGTIRCTLPKQSENKVFSMETKGQFYQLIRRRERPILINADFPPLHNHIEISTPFHHLCERAKADRFEPEIKGFNKDQQYLIECVYHLAFNNKELVLIPFIQLFKSLIDFFLDDRFNYS